MNDKPPSTSGSGTPGLVARIKRALTGEPWSRDEIQTLIQTEVELDAEERSMLAGVLEVSETQVREVMVPRSQMVVIDIEQAFDEILALIVDSGHSRFPVIGEDRDEILGILLAKDLLRYFGTGATQDVAVRKLLRPASVIPESKRLKALLKEFRASHNQMVVRSFSQGTKLKLIFTMILAVIAFYGLKLPPLPLFSSFMLLTVSQWVVTAVVQAKTNDK